MNGYVGSKEGKQINLSFLNIALPDQKVSEGGIFTHATLLESFSHDGSSSVATYNFYRKDDRKNEDIKGQYDHHNVTYGWEISESTEYSGLQTHYYDKDTYTSAEGLVKDADDKTDFSEYLPYVCNVYNEADMTHEIKVNQRVADITEGCGTYEHPYVITMAEEMTIISEYLASGSARKDWKITVSKEPAKYCTESSPQDITYQFDGEQWEAVENTGMNGSENWTPMEGETPIDQNVMLEYMLNAYYDIQGIATAGSHKLELTNFGGFGISTRPFRGVLTTTKGTTVILKGAGTCNGLIPYSYGSVVRNLTISYEYSDNNEQTGKTLNYSTNTTKTSDYFPNVSFGGVIGCVLGGDNIIDNVTISIEPGWLTLSGDKKHLITVGGYVGAVSGGGVIFRNMSSESDSKPGLADTMLSSGSGSVAEAAYTSLYVNPYVGRVLDGYVFQEVDKTTIKSLENTNKNYQINNLLTTDTGCITGSSGDITVKDVQGLLILSAIVNSGAASGGMSNAYSSTENVSNETNRYLFGGRYGKVRNASYLEIGDRTDSGDIVTAGKDDKKAVGTDNLPYLIQKYCSIGAFTLAGSSGVKISLDADENKQVQTYHMAAYGNGYQGISARYVSSAILTGETNQPANIAPELNSLNGQGNTVEVDVQIREYADDDFPAASAGGVFNFLRVGSSETTIQNLIIVGKTTSDGINITYYTSAGEPTDTSNGTNKNFVDVGGFAGTTSSISANANNANMTNIVFDHVQVQNMTITGPVNAGGLLGSTGRKLCKEDEEPSGTALLLQPSENTVYTVGVKLQDCAYDTITVDAPNAAAGFVAYIDNTDNKDVSSYLTVLKGSSLGGANATIGKENNGSQYAGGAFGYVKTKMYVNCKSDGTGDYGTAVMNKVNVSAEKYAGGFIGEIGDEVLDKGKEYRIKNAKFQGESGNLAIVSVKSTDDENSIIGGGIVGYGKGDGGKCQIENSHLLYAQINQLSDFDLRSDKWNTTTYQRQRTGGIIGYITNSKVTFSKCTVKKSTVYGRITGGIAGGSESAVSFKECEVSGDDKEHKQTIRGLFTAGGMMGFMNTSGDVSIQNSKVSYLTIKENHWGTGAFIGDSDNQKNGGTIYLFDSEAKEIDITAGGGSWYCAGGIIGNLRGNVTGSNVLFSGITLNCDKETGLLFGTIVSTGYNVNIAGISIQGIPESNSDLGLTGDNNGVIKCHNAIAFADYAGSASALDADEETFVEPYVVTSPESSLYLSSEETNTYLYGDGAYWTSEKNVFTTRAQEIWKNRNAVSAGHYAYKNIGLGENDFAFDKRISTYKANLSTEQSSEMTRDDFPVLQLTAGDAGAVSQYLDILTNGGFSNANTLNNGDKNIHVTASTKIYHYADNKFTKDETTKPALQVKADSSGHITFQTTTDYDNGRNRFTLLTVTFTETDADGAAHMYNVFVPIIVRRMLEVDFTATLGYGTNFKSTDYSKRYAHVLEKFGSSITGYLTYTYNSKDEGYVDYGWQSYIDGGGNVADSMNKQLIFNQTEKLPAGTQLSLIDCWNDQDKVYYYTVTGNETDNTIELSMFKDSGGIAYKEPSIAEIMQVTADPDTSGKFVKVDADGKPEGGTEDKNYSKPTVRIGDDYYRIAEGDEKGQFKMKVNDGKLHTGTISNIQESYYLVITVPENTTSNVLDGKLQTTITDQIPHEIHYRTIQKGPDGQNNTASTYIISKGYQQTLDEINITDLSKKMSTADSKMKIDVVDTITFSNEQVYLDSNSGKDELYMRFVGSLQKTVDGKTLSEQFPSGTTGEATFYVYQEGENGRTYYQYTERGWRDIGNTKDAAVSYTWTSNGGNMELPLSTDGTLANAISLQEVRQKVKNGIEKGNSTFYVEVTMEAAIPATGLSVVPESKTTGTMPSDYVKLAYSSQLSAEQQSLGYSNNRATVQNTTTAYYQEEPAGAKLSYEADSIGQLGINLLDLQNQNLDASGEHALIDTTAIYDLSAFKNLSAVLKESDGIKFSLTLLPKSTEKQEDYQAAVSNAKDYLQVEVTSPDSGELNYSNGTWSWTVPKGTYWADDNIRTDSVFDGSLLTQVILLKVNVKNVEKEAHYYSNYKVVLTAEILKADGTTIEKSRLDDNIIYTLAKINTEFVS